MTEKKLSGDALNAKLSEVNSWERKDDKIHKRFNFENFAEALDFVNKIGTIAEKQDHHPDINFGWGYAEIYLTTHDAGGLTNRDFELARKVNEIWEHEVNSND